MPSSEAALGALSFIPHPLGALSFIPHPLGVQHRFPWRFSTTTELLQLPAGAVAVPSAQALEGQPRKADGAAGAGPELPFQPESLEMCILMTRGFCSLCAAQSTAGGASAAHLCIQDSESADRGLSPALSPALSPPKQPAGRFSRARPPQCRAALKTNGRDARGSALGEGSQLSLGKAAKKPRSSLGASPSLVSCCHLPVPPAAACQECVGFPRVWLSLNRRGF